MRRLLLIGASTATLALAACATTPPQVITKVQTVVVQTPSPLLQDCPISQPPSRKDYLAADMEGRENLLSNYILSLLKDLHVCNTQIGMVRDFQNKQIKLYQDPKKGQ